jgi:hypothetical protein
MSDPFTFGVFPFGLAGGPGGLAAGPPDDFRQIRRLLRILQGDGPPLLSLRHQARPIAGIDTATPIRICENGWPTGPGRAGHRQAEVLDTMLRAIHARRRELNITHWELFALRDADTSRDDPFHQFGIVRDDYTPKPAFGRLRKTMAELR